MEAFILSASSSLVSAETQSDLGFSLTITSLSSMLMGSVGTSAAPILLTTCSTSGKFFRMIFSILVVVAMVLVSEVPVFNTGWITKSPSSNVGTNSPPMEEKIKTATTKSPDAPQRTFLTFCNAQVITGKYNEL